MSFKATPGHSYNTANCFWSSFWLGLKRATRLMATHYLSGPFLMSSNEWYHICKAAANKADTRLHFSGLQSSIQFLQSPNWQISGEDMWTTNELHLPHSWPIVFGLLTWLAKRGVLEVSIWLSSLWWLLPCESKLYVYATIIFNYTLKHCRHDHLWIHRLSVSVVSQTLVSTVGPGLHEPHFNGGQDVVLGSQVSMSTHTLYPTVLEMSA